MKKILSLIIAALFIVTMSLNAFAVEVGTFTITISDAEVATGTETVTLTFTVTADAANWGATNLTIPVKIPEGLTYVEDSLSASPAGTSLTIGSAAVPAEGLFSYDCEADDSDLNVDGTSTTFSATFAIADPSAEATYEISVLTSGDFDIADEENWDSYTNLYDTQFDTTDKGVITVKAAGPSVNTVAAAETIKTDVMTSQEPAGYEKGQGFALRFAAGDVANFTKMIWALTVDGAKKYSDAVAFNAASIADDAQVEVAATFLNQNEAAVSAVNAIFCTEDGTEYFTDAADAGNKKKAE